MPVMDGREFVTQLKAIDAYKNIPVIMLTALADTENQFSMLRLGIDDYVVKPFIANELVVRVYNLLFNNLQRAAYNALPAEQGEVPLPSKDADEFREKVAQIVLSKINSIDLSVADVAKEAGYSEKRLYTLSKSLTGCTPAQLIKEVRLMKAYELLVTGQVYKLDDLAKRVGYEHLSYFSKQFFERFGKRPSEYMK
jgi:AraC-like DNA-binding protein